MYTAFIKTISNLIPLESDDLDLIKSIFKYRSVKKDTVLIDKGDYTDFAFYINSGYLRYYTIVSTGEEQTIHLISPGEFATSFCSFINNTKSEDILKSITDSELLYVSKNDLELLYATDTKWQLFGRKLMETLLLEKEKRIINQISLPAQERYIRLLETNSSMIQNVPIQYIASYLGIKPESLSRIRRQIFLTNVK